MSRIAICLLLLFVARGASGSCCGLINETQKIIGSDTSGGDEFGIGVGIDGDVAIVGAVFDDEEGTDAGAAYIFRYYPLAGWLEEQKITAFDAAAGDHFGNCVDIDGNVAVVGAGKDDGGTGAAYVFRFNSGIGQWVQEQKLTASDGATGDNFGCASISGNAIIVGAKQDDDGGSSSGSAYVFRYSSGSGLWSEEQKLTASDAAAGDGFGSRAAISGDLAIVGATFGDGSVSDSGAAYVFRYDSGQEDWDQEEKLTASDGAASDFFGQRVEISNDLIIVGAWGNDPSGSNSGSAYIFRYDDQGNDWDQEALLTPADGASDDLFGWSIAIDGDVALIGAPFDDNGGISQTGSAYLYRFDGTDWDEDTKMLASDPLQGGVVGYSIALDGDRGVAGAYGAGGENSGAAYVLDGLTDDCNGNDEFDICDIQCGQSSDCNVNGVPDDCERCAGDTDSDGDVDFGDLLNILSEWGACDCCPEDFTADDEVDFNDLLVVLANWGVCPGESLPEPESLEEALEGTCLDMQDWDTYYDIMTDPENTTTEKNNATCWFEHYAHCNASCGYSPCGGVDPFNNACGGH